MAAVKAILAQDQLELLCVMEITISYTNIQNALVIVQIIKQSIEHLLKA